MRLCQTGGVLESIGNTPMLRCATDDEWPWRNRVENGAQNFGDR